MEEVIEKRGSKEEIKIELLDHLQKLDTDDWKLIGWHTNQMKKIRWLKRPEKLSRSSVFKIITVELEKGLFLPRHHNPDGLVRYQSGGTPEPDLLSVESVTLSLWLMKEGKMCIVCYGCHKFDNTALEASLGGVGYSICFKNIEDVFLPLLQGQAGQFIPRWQ